MHPDWAIVGTDQACKACDGFGTLGQIVKYRDNPERYFEREIKCPDCGGSGRENNAINQKRFKDRSYL